MVKCCRVAVLGISLAVVGCQKIAGLDVLIAPATPAVHADLAVQQGTPDFGRAQLAAGNFALAERSFRETVERNPGDAAAWIGLAAAYDNLGRFDLADRAYTQAIRTGGETLEVINNLGYSFLLRGDNARAMTQFKLALQLDPTNAVVANNIRLLQRTRPR